MNSKNEFLITSQIQERLPQRLFKFLFSAHPSISDVVERRKAQLSAILAFALTCTNIIALVFIGRQSIDATFYIQASLTVVTFTAYLLSRFPRFVWGSILLISSLSLSGFANVLSGSSDPTNALYVTIPVSFAIGSALLPVWGNVIQYIASNVGVMVLPVVYPSYPFSEAGSDLSLIFTIGILLIIVQVFRNNIERDRLAEVRNINQELRVLQSGLEQRVAERTKALATSAEVTRRLATVLDPRQLVSAVVNEVRNAFDYYYAQIYLLDEASENLVMSGGTGEAGAAMLSRGHSLSKGRGLVGRAADTNTSVLIPDVLQEEGWFPNDLLPETKSEAAVPISAGNQVLGVLDVQHNAVNGLTAEDVTLLESLAGQVAITLQNARAYEESRQQAELESLVNAIGQKIQRTTTMEDTLQTAIREIGLALGAARVSARVATRMNAASESSNS